MKKAFILGTAFLLLAGLLTVACENKDEENGKRVAEDDFSLTVTLDKTVASIGDTVTATVVFKNLSGRDIKAELPDWIASYGGKSKEDILEAEFIPEGSEWGFIDIKFPRPKILIGRGDVIERQFERAVTELGNLEVRAGAFFIAAKYPTTNHIGMQIASDPIEILVQ
jgi:hypothetical protein